MAGKKICPLLCKLLIMAHSATAQKNSGEACPYLVGKQLVRVEQNYGKHLAQMEASKTIAVILQVAKPIAAVGGRYEGAERCMLLPGLVAAITERMPCLWNTSRSGGPYDCWQTMRIDSDWWVCLMNTTSKAWQ